MAESGILSRENITQKRVSLGVGGASESVQHGAIGHFLKS